MTNEANKDALRKWVAALRSDEYSQGRFMLAYIENDKTNYCCLGVACEVFSDDLNIKRTTHGFEDGMTVFYNGHDGTLPIDLANHMKVDRDPIVGYLEIDRDKTLIRSTAANDIYKLRFSEIADMIEEYYELKD